jgi:hypothetical protein
MHLDDVTEHLGVKVDYHTAGLQADPMGDMMCWKKKISNLCQAQ